MKISTSDRSLEITEMVNEDILGSVFRNFAGEKRVGKSGKWAGRVVNDEGKRNFNIRIPDEYMDYFMSIGTNIGEWGGNPEEGEPPIHYFKVNVNTLTAKTPPVIYMENTAGKMNELPVTSYAKLDGMNIESAKMIINISFKYDAPAFYLDSAIVKPHLNSIREKFLMQAEMDDLEPTIPEDEIPFQ